MDFGSEYALILQQLKVIELNHEQMDKAVRLTILQELIRKCNAVFTTSGMNLEHIKIDSFVLAEIGRVMNKIIESD